MVANAYSVGVDQSANHTGVAVLSREGELLLSELIEPKTRGIQRLVEIRDTLIRLLDPFGPFEIGVWESYALEATNQAFLLGEVGGIVQLVLHDRASRVESCAPVALKKFTTGNARADKAEMMQHVADRWGAPFDDDNRADAYALAQLGRVLLDSSLTRRRDQLEVRAKILAPKKKREKPFRMNKGLL